MIWPPTSSWRKPGGPACRRVHVIGAAGSGKTFLAAALSAGLGAEHHDLDRVALRRAAGAGQVTPVPWPQRRAAADEVAERSRWVTEGIYLGWTEPLIAAADLVVWLDVPWWLATYRIIVRHVRRSLRGDNEWKGIRLLLRFLWTTRNYYLGPGGDAAREHADTAIDRRMTVMALAPYAAKTVRCHGRRDVTSILHRISSGIHPPA